MEYFGISNSNNSFINDSSLFPFIDEQCLSESIKTGKVFDLVSNKAAPTLPSFNSNPVLFEHREKEMVKNIWDNIKDGDIITNRGAKRALTYGCKNVAIKEKWVTVNGCKKRIYLIWRVKGNFVPQDQMSSGSHAEAVVFHHPSEHSYSIYRYMNRYNKELECTEHFTCEIDGFFKPSGEPIEFKSVTPENNEAFNIPLFTKVKHGIQCKLAGINNIVYGVINGSTMQLRHCKINEMGAEVNQKVEQAFDRINANMKKLVENYKNH